MHKTYCYVYFKKDIKSILYIKQMDIVDWCGAVVVLKGVDRFRPNVTFFFTYPDFGPYIVGRKYDFQWLSKQNQYPNCVRYVF